MEVLDDPRVPSEIRERSMRDVVRANTLFGGTRAAMRALRSILPRLPGGALLLDVGTGLADIPARAVAEGRERGVALEAIGLDASESLLRSARVRLSAVIVGNALRLPVADGSADVVTCSQLLHHFADDEATRLIAELNRASRRFVIVSELRRSWIAAWAFRVASVGLRFHPVTRHDGFTSVLRGFTAPELEVLLHRATGVRPTVRRSAFWRLIATWEKSDLEARVSRPPR